jgi:hypothetical protein
LVCANVCVNTGEGVVKVKDVVPAVYLHGNTSSVHHLYPRSSGVEAADHPISSAARNGGDLEQIKFLLGHSSIQTTERYLGSEQDIEIAVNDNLGL